MMENQEYWDEVKRLMTTFYYRSPEDAKIIVDEIYKRYGEHVKEPSLYTAGPLYMAEACCYWSVDNEGRVVDPD